MTQQEIIEITDLNHFVQAINHWHSNVMSRALHFLEVPDGITAQIGSNDTAELLVLSGDTLKGFRLGVELALNEFRSLPFKYELEENRASPDEPTNPVD